MSSLGPLANLLRPMSLKDFIGQKKLVGPNSLIQFFLHSRRLSSLIFWGPPGTGKTTLASLLGKEFDCEFISVNAIEVGAKVLRDIGESARLNFRGLGKQTIVFVDEIHRLNKSQQDVLLPFIEKGDFILIGATTENPGYELNRALLSRCHLMIFEPHSTEDLKEIWQRASLQLGLPESAVTEPVVDSLIHLSDGDARRLLNLTEIVALYLEQNPRASLSNSEELKLILPKGNLAYDKNRDSHYDIISAFIKSIRGSDADAGLYYLARMIEGGEDPKFIARRLVILASEDIGNADPRALQIAIAGAEAVSLVGLPECAINLAQVVTYLSSAPKSNRSYKGWLKAKETAEKFGSLQVPIHLRSSKVPSLVKVGFGADYKYPHDAPNAWVKQAYLPEDLIGTEFYIPSSNGFEKTIKEYRDWLKGKPK